MFILYDWGLHWALGLAWMSAAIHMSLLGKQLCSFIPMPHRTVKADSALGYTHSFHHMFPFGPFIAFPGYGDLSLDKTSRNFPLGSRPLL